MAENSGDVVQVIGPSVDIRFPASRPFGAMIVQRLMPAVGVRSLREL